MSLMPLTLYDFYFQPLNMAKSMNLDSNYILHLHDDDTFTLTSTSSFRNSTPMGCPIQFEYDEFDQVAPLWFTQSDPFYIDLHSSNPKNTLKELFDDNSKVVNPTMSVISEEVDEVNIYSGKVLLS